MLSSINSIGPFSCEIYEGISDHKASIPYAFQYDSCIGTHTSYLQLHTHLYIHAQSYAVVVHIPTVEGS